MKKRWCIEILIILIISVLFLSLFSLNTKAFIYCLPGAIDCEYDREPYTPSSSPGRTCSYTATGCIYDKAVKCPVTDNCGDSYKAPDRYAEQCYYCPPEGNGAGPTAAIIYGGKECYASGKYGCLSSACSCIETNNEPEECTKHSDCKFCKKCVNNACVWSVNDESNKCPQQCCSKGDGTYFCSSNCEGPLPPGTPPSSNPPPDTTEPGCDCTPWVQVGGCHERCSGFLEVRYERTCTPAGCDATAKCREHPDCCICTDWKTVAGCGERGCNEDQVKQTRVCPVDCDTEERCKKMDYCSDCTLTNAEWTLNNNEISETDENVIVTLEVEGSSLCDGSLITFDIKEKDTLDYDEYSPDPDPVTFNNGIATASWKTKWTKDEFNFLTMDNDPEYYFTAKVASKEITSGELKVNPVLGECGDSECDTGETPVNCPEDCGCKVNEKACVINDEITCVPYEFGCDDQLSCDDNFCLPGLICVTDNGNIKCVAIETSDGYCPSDPLIQPYDPDCCNLQNAYWSTHCTGAGKTVILSVVGDESCDSKELDIKIYENDEPGIYLPSPNPVNFEGDLATTYWETKYMDDGMSQGNPEFYYTATINELSLNSNLMEVVNCNVEQDADCDGINDDNDLCWNTPECVNVNGDGCSSNQASCLVFWDCSAAEWDECSETVEDKLYRDVTLCSYTGDLNSPCNNIELLPKTKECAPEEAFPFFTAFNLVIAVMIISLYYFFFFIKKKPFKK